MKLSIQTRLAFATVLASLFIAGCGSKKKSDDQSNLGAPAIGSDAMSFNAQGSDSGQIAGLETVRFEYDKAVIAGAAKKQLAGNAAWMKTNAKVNVQIEGHCDARGSVEYNLSLGERRAKAVRDYMVGLGIAAARLSVISYGKEKLLAQGDSEADMAKNRRANFVPLQ